jgi:hypothetical protein
MDLCIRFILGHHHDGLLCIFVYGCLVMSDMELLYS